MILEYEECHEIEKRSPNNGLKGRKHFRRDNSRNGIRGIMKPVDEVENQRKSNN